MHELALREKHIWTVAPPKQHILSTTPMGNLTYLDDIASIQPDKYSHRPASVPLARFGRKGAKVCFLFKLDFYRASQHMSIVHAWHFRYGRVETVTLIKIEAGKLSRTKYSPGSKY